MDQIGKKVFREVDAVVNDTYVSIPYTLGKVDAYGWVLRSPEKLISQKAIAGYTSVWPLRFALRFALVVRTSTDAQREYIFEYVLGSQYFIFEAVLRGLLGLNK